MAILFTQAVDHGSFRVLNVATPTANGDATNKGYVDSLVNSLIGGLSWQKPVRAASTGNVSVAAPGATMDGVTLATNDRVLLKNQTTGSENGVYVFNGAAAALTRAADVVKAGTVWAANEGTANADIVFLLTNDGTVTVGTTALTFSAINALTGTTYTAGAAIDLTGNAIAVKYGTGLKIDGTGNLALDTSAIPGGVVKYSSNVGDGVNDTLTITHNLNTFDVGVNVYELTSGNRATVLCESRRPSVNTVQLIFGSIPATGQYRVVITG